MVGVLGDVYAVAMNAIGPLPLQTAPEEYGELGSPRCQVGKRWHVFFAEKLCLLMFSFGQPLLESS